jgi:hypothetical protein
VDRNTPLCAAVALLASVAGPAFATASLRATASAAASAHNVFEQTTGSPIVGPDSLQVALEAEAAFLAVNPTPPPDDWEMSARVSGVAESRYGALAGSAEADAWSTPGNDFYLAGGDVALNAGYTDTARVVSDTLADGTPVTVSFSMTLDAVAFHFTDAPGPVVSDKIGAAARHELEVRLLDAPTQLPARGALLVNSRGESTTSRLVTVDTAIGHRLEILSDLFLGAGADPDHQFTFGTTASAEVRAGQTAELFYEPSGDVRLETESGHDYAAPEPGRATLLALAAAALLLRRTSWVLRLRSAAG